MKLVDADVADAELRRLYDVWNLAMAPAEGREIVTVDKNMRLLKLMRSFLQSMPAVDVAQAVRCGECKYSKFSRTQTQRYTCDYTYSPCRGRCMDADFGCLYGEKKGEGPHA